MKLGDQISRGRRLAGGPGRSASSLLRLRRRQPSVSGACLAPAPCSTRKRAVLHDLDAALPGRLRRGRCACPRLSRLELIGGSGRTACRYASAARAFRLQLADRLRAGAGRRSGSGWRQGRVRLGRPLLSRPRGAVGSGPAAVESAALWSAAVSAVAWSCGCVVVKALGVRWAERAVTEWSSLTHHRR